MEAEDSPSSRVTRVCMLSVPPERASAMRSTLLRDEGVVSVWVRKRSQPTSSARLTRPSAVISSARTAKIGQHNNTTSSTLISRFHTPTASLPRTITGAFIVQHFRRIFHRECLTKGKIFRELRQKSAFFARKNEKILIGWKKCGK